jgi:hypothetical protein
MKLMVHSICFGLCVTIRAQEAWVPRSIVQEVPVLVIDVQAQGFAIPFWSLAALRAKLLHSTLKESSFKDFEFLTSPIVTITDEHSSPMEFLVSSFVIRPAVGPNAQEVGCVKSESLHPGSYMAVVASRHTET